MARSRVKQTGDGFMELAVGIGNEPSETNEEQEKNDKKDEKGETIEVPPATKKSATNSTGKKKRTSKGKTGRGRPRRDIKTVKKYFELRQDLNEYLVRKSEAEERSVTTLINKAIKEMMERDKNIYK